MLPVVTGTAEPQWTDELQAIPVLGIDGAPVVVAPTKLTGIVLVSRESADDYGWNLTRQIEQVLQDKWSATIDRDILAGAGPAPVPVGLLAGAPEVADDMSLWGAAVRAKGEIATSGGNASHLIASPGVIAAEEGRMSAMGTPVWPDGLGKVAGLTVVPSPFASQPLVLDAKRVFLA